MGVYVLRVPVSQRKWRHNKWTWMVLMAISGSNGTAKANITIKLCHFISFSFQCIAFLLSIFFLLSIYTNVSGSTYKKMGRKFTWPVGKAMYREDIYCSRIYVPFKCMSMFTLCLFLLIPHIPLWLHTNTLPMYRTVSFTFTGRILHIRFCFASHCLRS